MPSVESSRLSKIRRFRQQVVLICLASVIIAGGWYWRKIVRSTQNDLATGFKPPVGSSQSMLEDPSSENALLMPAPAETDSSSLTNNKQLIEPPASDLVHPLDRVLVIAKEILIHIRSDVKDYTATLTKRERIKGKLTDEVTMSVKIRHPSAAEPQPLCVYLKLIPPSTAAGREVIWIDGQNDGKLITYQFGLTMKLDPQGTLAMMGNRYPISEIGILRLAEKLVEKGERDRQLGDCRVEYFKDQILDGRSCTLIQVTHPLPDPKFDFHIAQVFIDDQLRLPVRYAAYLWPDAPGQSAPLEEECTYSNIQLNVGLSDLDFDPTNPDYKFPK
jgi:Protein of unknown function (DUF1571)